MDETPCPDCRHILEAHGVTGCHWPTSPERTCHCITQHPAGQLLSSWGDRAVSDARRLMRSEQDRLDGRV